MKLKRRSSIKLELQEFEMDDLRTAIDEVLDDNLVRLSTDSLLILYSLRDELR